MTSAPLHRRIWKRFEPAREEAFLCKEIAGYSGLAASLGRTCFDLNPFPHRRHGAVIDEDLVQARCENGRLEY